MPETPLRIAAISLHTSPLEDPGGDDAGGMNVVVLELSLALARAGHTVELFTRRADPDAPDTVEVAPGVRLHHLDAGPPTPLAKSAMEQAIDPFREGLRARLPQLGVDLVHSHHWFSGVAALLFTARLQPLKAPDLALEVLGRLDPALGARLVLAGGGSQDFADYTGELHERAEQLGVADRVRWAGSMGRDELAEAMRASSVLLLTSWSETFGLVALEAQASGTPVIAWQCAGGVREAVGPGGEILTSRDPDVWAEAIEALVGDGERFAAAAAAARAFATTRTWEASAHSLVALYREQLVRSEAAR